MASKAGVQATTPTAAVYGGLQAAYSHFNKELFAGTLPPCLITMQRHARAYGYFSGDRFVRAHKDSTGYVDEIALNPTHVAERSREATLSTLVHEMAHQWQHHNGKRPTRCYHDRQWANKMLEVGLHPSDTGKEGGKETGPKVSHFIVQHGPFAKACATFLKDNEAVLYADRMAIMKAAKLSGKGEGEEGEEGEGKAKSKGRAKFCCPECELNAWAKPGANLRCDDCNEKLVPAEEAKDAD